MGKGNFRKLKMEERKMLLIDKVFERMDFYGVNCENLRDDIRCIFEMVKGKEGKRKGEVLGILKEEREGISVKEIGERLGIKGSNVNSVVMELRKEGVDILSINRKMILGEYVNIG